MMLLDESADDKSGAHTVSSGRRGRLPSVYNGRRGKVDNCIVGVFLSCVDASCQYHTWIDGELFLVEDWFSDGWAERRRQAGVADDREFQAKLELGWQMIQRVHPVIVPWPFSPCRNRCLRFRK